MTYEIAIEDFILMETDDKEEAITAMREIINGETSIDATEAWINVWDGDEYLYTIQDKRFVSQRMIDNDYPIVAI